MNARWICMLVLGMGLFRPAIGGEGQSDGDRWIRAGGKPLAQYRLSAAAGRFFKPYMVGLCTPGGINVLRDAPEDHLHHHGLMMAFRVNGLNYWEEVAPCGTQFSEPAGERRSDEEPIQSLVRWGSSQDRDIRMLERRAVSLVEANKDFNLFRWTSEFQTGGAEIKLEGSHYNGLGMRFVKDMDLKGSFTNSENEKGKVFRGTEVLMKGKWCAYTARVQDREVTVLMIDHPTNPRAATWFGMTAPFAYLSATIGLNDKPLTLARGETLRLEYGVALMEGPIDQRRISQAVELFLKPDRKR